MRNIRRICLAWKKELDDRGDGIGLLILFVGAVFLLSISILPHMQHKLISFMVLYAVCTYVFLALFTGTDPH